MSTVFSRRDFLKLGGLSLGSLAFAPSLNVFGPDFDKINYPIQKIEQVEFGTELQLGTSPSTPLLRYAFDVSALASDPSITARPHVLQDRLRQLGHGQLATGRQLELASASPSVVNLLGLAEHKLFGAPVSLSEQSADPLVVSTYLLSQVDGNVTPQSDGKVVRFNRDFPAVVDLMPGDVLYSQSHELDGVTRAGQMVVLARSHSSQTGEHLALIMEQNGDNVSISWRDNQSLDQLKRTSPYIRFAAIRSQEAFHKKKTIDHWLKTYPELQTTSTTDDYNHIPNLTKSQFIASLRCTADQLSKPTSDRNGYITSQIKSTFFELNDSIAKWCFSQPYDQNLYGVNDLLFCLYIYGRRSDNGEPLIRVSPLSLYEFIEQQSSGNLRIESVIDTPTNVEVPDDLVLVRPTGIEDVSLADLVFVSPSKIDAKPRVGIVTEDKPQLTTMFFNHDGDGISREIDHLSLTEIITKHKNEIVVLRTRYEHHIKDIRAAVEPTKLKYSDLPPEITHSSPGSMIDFSAIPLFANLQNEVINAPDLAARANAIRLILANIGVETSDYAEFNTGTRWSENETWKCVDYSRTAFQAIVKDGWKHLNTWIDDNGKPTFGTGRNIGSAAMSVWLNKYGEEYGFEDVTRKPREYRIARLAAGDIMYGAEYVQPGGGSWHDIGDTWIIYGMPGKNGEVIPVFSKASGNFLGIYPRNIYHFDNPGYYYGPRGPAQTQTWNTKFDFNTGILFSYKIPLRHFEPKFDGKL
ncbi:hypothetical protein KBC75_00680 [Candidatus Shapirobacteria bacterium]|nr:hypothetical protein [Candidatus Shapirobacteria bacterium]